MNIIRQTSLFKKWVSSLKDLRAKALIIGRIDRAEDGNFGDHCSVGEGVMEMRIHYGPGWRVYYAWEGGVVFLLLLGENKSSQAKDIAKAQELWAAIRKGKTE